VVGWADSHWSYIIWHLSLKKRVARCSLVSEKKMTNDKCQMIYDQ
jgi:hypothetical protein